MSKSYITQEILDKAMSWDDYMALNEKLVAEKRTSGPNQTEELAQFTDLNLTRMHRILKTLVLEDEVKETLKNLKEEYVVFAIAEAWCGDTAQNLPVVAKIVEASDKLDFKIVLRDDNPEIMDQFLTNGNRSIPKIILLKKNSFEEIGYWGPKPAEGMKILAEYKANRDTISTEEYHKRLHTWYAKNKNVDVQHEIIALFK